MGEKTVYFYYFSVDIFCVGSVILKEEKKIGPNLLILILENSKL